MHLTQSILNNFTHTEKTGQLVTTVAMPDYPGVEKILEAAEKMYAFVNAGAKK